MAIGEVFVNTVTYTRMYICELIRQSRRFVGALGWGYALLSSCCRKRLVNKLGVKGDVGMGHWSRHATHWMTAATEFNCSCKTIYVYSICEKNTANWNGIFSQAICLFSCTWSALFAYASADMIIYFLLCIAHLFICSHFFMRLGLTTANRRWAMDVLLF